jgi:hypothetical protein
MAKDYEDFIDFPCSPAWLDYYNDIGLTPRNSGEKGNSEIGILSEILRELKENHIVLKNLLNEWKSFQLSYQQTKEARKEINIMPTNQPTRKLNIQNKGFDL